MKCRTGERVRRAASETPLPGAMHVADTLRREFEANPIRWNGQLISITASVGATTVWAGEVDPLAVLARADAALYRAKEDGRNCVRFAADPTAIAVGA